MVSINVGPRKVKAMLVSPASEPALEAGKRIGDDEPWRAASFIAAVASAGPSALVTTTPVRSWHSSRPLASMALATALAVSHAAGSA